MEKVQTILFDLDGTLIDHFDVIFRCYEKALGDLNVEIPTPEEVRRAVGGSMEKTILEFVTEADHTEAVRLFREHFDKIYLDDIHVNPGGEWLLRNLKKEGRQLAVFTNKQGKGSRAICRSLGLDRYLEAVFGSLDTPFLKPQEAFTRHALETLAADASTSCMVGDSPFDIGAAHSVGMPCFCVTTGTHSREELEHDKAEGVFEDLYALGQAVFGIAPPLAHARRE